MMAILEIVTMLIKNGADVNIKTPEYGLRALDFAKGHKDIEDLLISKGAKRRGVF